MSALDEVSKNWLAAKMVHKLFDAILGNKHLEERLQKAAGNRHKKQAQQPAAKIVTQPTRESSSKRKYDDLDDDGLYHTNGGAPTAQMSYERSRPQTPAITPSREPAPGIPTINTRGNSPELMRHDAFMGASRTTTRPGTPSHGMGLSYPGTPPDLFLVTRDSPFLPSELWNSFQPDQLFPAEANISIPIFSPQQQSSLIDPALSSGSAGVPHQHMPQQQGYQYADDLVRRASYTTPQSTNSHLNAYHASQHQQHPQQLLPHSHPQQQHQQQQQKQSHHVNESEMWSQLQLAAAQAGATQSNEDAMSVNSSMSQGPIVPSTLNAEDWFQFFGIQGDLNGPGSVGVSGGLGMLQGFGGRQ